MNSLYHINNTESKQQTLIIYRYANSYFIKKSRFNVINYSISRPKQYWKMNNICALQLYHGIVYARAIKTFNHFSKRNIHDLYIKVLFNPHKPVPVFTKVLQLVQVTFLASKEFGLDLLCGYSYRQSLWQSCAEHAENDNHQLLMRNVRKAILQKHSTTFDQVQCFSERYLQIDYRRTVDYRRIINFNLC